MSVTRWLQELISIDCYTINTSLSKYKLLSFTECILSFIFTKDPTIDSKNILKECGAKWREVKGDAVKLAALAADSAEAQSQERPESTAADRRNMARMCHKRIKRLVS